jgi:hypothetical protein
MVTVLGTFRLVSLFASCSAGDLSFHPSFYLFGSHLMVMPGISGFYDRLADQRVEHNSLISIENMI